MSSRLPLAVTMGEPAGVGGELVLKAWRLRRTGHRPFFAIDSCERLSHLSLALGLGVPVKPIAEPAEAAAVFPEALPVLPVALAALSREHVQDNELMMAGSVVTVVPVLVLFLALQRHYLAGLMAGAVKG